MENSVNLANRFREVLLNGTWIAGTNYRNQLVEVSLEQAMTKIADLNSIAALTYHINYYIAGILKVFEGGDLEIHDKFSFDLPEQFTKKDWDNLVISLITNSEKFADHVENMTKAQLNSIFVDEKYGTYRRNIEGVIEHSYYHLGQVSLIKKMVNAEIAVELT